MILRRDIDNIIIDDGYQHETMSYFSWEDTIIGSGGFVEIETTLFIDNNCSDFNV